MPTSPNDNSSNVVKLTILSSGSEIKDTYQVMGITVESAVNKIPYAQILFADGKMSKGKFEISESDDFKPGNEVEIKAGYGSSDTTIFKGIVIKQGISISKTGYSKLIVECKDKAVKMTIARKNANYLKKKDSDIISEIVGNNSGLSCDVKSTSVQFDEIVQYYSTDWDFVLARSEVNGFVIITEDGKLTIKPPDTGQSASLKVEYGSELMEFHGDLDSENQISEITAVSWDQASQKIVEQKGSAPSLNSQGDLDTKKLSEVLGCSDFRLQSSGTIDQDAVKAWADSGLLKSGLSRIKGRMKFQGNSDAKPGAIVELSGVGKRFDGDVYLSGVNHTITEGNWITEAGFGFSNKWHTEEKKVSSPPASGFLPGIQGLYIGKVMKLDEDPQGENRIQVSIPVLKAETEGIWARLSSFHASSGFGSFFIPEIDDEVIVGYFNSDPSHPVVLGSLYSSKLKPPYELTKDNYTKAVVTKTKMKIEFDDENKVITIDTPGSNKIVISDKDKSILLEDQNSNKIELGSDGITLDSPKDIKISAKGKISLDAVDQISVSSKADVNADGMNVNISAKTGAVVKGNATAELSASGQTTVKGAMVMIN